MEDWNKFAKDGCYKNEKEMLEHLYNVNRMSLAEIATKFNVSAFCIIYRMRKYSIKRRKIGYGNALKGTRRK